MKYEVKVDVRYGIGVGVVMRYNRYKMIGCLIFFGFWFKCVGLYNLDWVVVEGIVWLN